MSYSKLKPVDSANSATAAFDPAAKEQGITGVKVSSETIQTKAKIADSFKVSSQQAEKMLSKSVSNLPPYSIWNKETVTKYQQYLKPSFEPNSVSDFFMGFSTYKGLGLSQLIFDKNAFHQYFTQDSFLADALFPLHTPSSAALPVANKETRRAFANNPALRATHREVLDLALASLGLTRNKKTISKAANFTESLPHWVQKTTEGVKQRALLLQMIQSLYLLHNGETADNLAQQVSIILAEFDLPAESEIFLELKTKVSERKKQVSKTPISTSAQRSTAPAEPEAKASANETNVALFKKYLSSYSSDDFLLQTDEQILKKFSDLKDHIFPLEKTNKGEKKIYIEQGLLNQFKADRSLRANQLKIINRIFSRYEYLLKNGKMTRVRPITDQNDFYHAKEITTHHAMVWMIIRHLSLTGDKDLAQEIKHFILEDRNAYDYLTKKAVNAGNIDAFIHSAGNMQQPVSLTSGNQWFCHYTLPYLNMNNKKVNPSENISASYERYLYTLPDSSSVSAEKFNSALKLVLNNLCPIPEHSMLEHNYPLLDNSIVDFFKNNVKALKHRQLMINQSIKHLNLKISNDMLGTELSKIALNQPLFSKNQAANTEQLLITRLIRHYACTGFMLTATRIQTELLKQAEKAGVHENIKQLWRAATKKNFAEIVNAIPELGVDYSSPQTDFYFSPEVDFLSQQISSTEHLSLPLHIKEQIRPEIVNYCRHYHIPENKMLSIQNMFDSVNPSDTKRFNPTLALAPNKIYFHGPISSTHFNPKDNTFSNDPLACANFVNNFKIPLVGEDAIERTLEIADGCNSFEVSTQHLRNTFDYQIEKRIMAKNMMLSKEEIQKADFVYVRTTLQELLKHDVTIYKEPVQGAIVSLKRKDAAVACELIE